MLARKPMNMQLEQKVSAKQHISVPRSESNIGVIDFYRGATIVTKAFMKLGAVLVVMILTGIIYNGFFDSAASICAKTENRVILLQQEKSMLELEVTELKSPNRIQTIATQELGMVAPDEYIYSSSKANKIEQKVVQSNSIIRD